MDAVRQRVSRGRGPLVESFVAGSAVDDERRCGDRREPLDREAGGDARVVDERVRQGLGGGPPGRVGHALEDVLGHADAAIEVHERVAAPSGRDELVNLGTEVLALRFRLEGKRRLQQRELVDRKAIGGGPERQDRARREAVDVGRASGDPDDRGEILDLALNGVRQRVAALPAPTAVVGDGGEVGGEPLSQRRQEPEASEAAGGVHQDDGRAVSDDWCSR